jgi:hypothetical protein
MSINPVILAPADDTLARMRIRRFSASLWKSTPWRPVLRYSKSNPSDANPADIVVHSPKYKGTPVSGWLQVEESQFILLLSRPKRRLRTPVRILRLEAPEELNARLEATWGPARFFDLAASPFKTPVDALNATADGSWEACVLRGSDWAALTSIPNGEADAITDTVSEIVARGKAVAIPAPAEEHAGDISFYLPESGRSEKIRDTLGKLPGIIWK